MKRGALAQRLEKFKKKRSISISIRLPREDVEGLDRVEAATDLRYDWLIRILVRRLLRFWKQNQKIEMPVYVCVMTEERAKILGLIKDQDDTDPTQVTWLSCKAKRKG